MSLTSDQLEVIGHTLNVLGAGGWLALLAYTASRHKGEKHWVDPLQNTRPLGEWLNLWSVMVSLGFYLCIMMVGLSLVETAAVHSTATFPASAGSASMPAQHPLGEQPSALARTVVDTGAKVLTSLLMLALLARGSPAGWRGAGLGTVRLGRCVLLAGGAYLLVYPLCVGSAELVDILLKIFASEWQKPTHSVIQILQNRQTNGWATLLAVISAVAVAPLAEELFFRGLLQNVLINTLGSRWMGIVLTGTLFGLVHMGSTPQYAFALAILGVWLGFLYQRFGSLWVCLLLHAIFNGVTVTLSLLSNGW